MKKSYIVILVLLAVFLAIGCSGSNNSSDNTATQANEPATLQEVKAEPVVIASWTGESTKNTETFTVPSDEWKITWDTKAGEYGDMNFQIYVYDANGVMKGVAANVIGANTESTIMRGAGDYYLMINTAQPYQITIETL